MSDNVAVTPGVGANIATDDVSGAHYQRVKLDIGGDGATSPVTSGNPLPISGTVTVTDGSGPLTVDGTVAATQSGTWSARITDGTTTATVRELGSNDALNVALVDGSGNQVTSFGGGVQYTEGDVDASITGTAMMIEGFGDDLQVVGQGNPLPVSISGSFPNLGIYPLTDDDTPFGGGDPLFAMGAVRDDALTTLAEADGDWNPLRTDSTGALWVKPSGTIAATQSGTWNISTVTALTDITNWGNIVDNAQFTDGTTRLLPAGYIFDETAGTSLTENDAAAARIDSKRAQVFTIEDATTRGRRTTVSAGGALLTDASATTQPVSQATASSLNAQVVGNIANGSSDSGNPVKFGGVGRTANPTAVTDGQRVNASFDDLGRQVVCVGQVRDLITDATTTIASSNAETTILAQAASTFHDLTLLVLTNATATAVTVTIKDSTAGTTRMIVDLAASGGAVIPFTRPMKQGAVNSNWTCTLSSASVTVHIYVQAEKNV